MENLSAPTFWYRLVILFNSLAQTFTGVNCPVIYITGNLIGDLTKGIIDIKRERSWAT